MHFPDPVVRQMVELDITVIEHRDGQLRVLEQDLAMKAKSHDAFTYSAALGPRHRSHFVARDSLRD